MAYRCFLIILLITAAWGGASPAAQKVPALYVFGDSLVDVGNNNYIELSNCKANFPHNGIDFPTHKPTGRFSNGKNTADFFAEKLGVATPPPYLSLSAENSALFTSGINFASGGAGIFDGDMWNYTCRHSISLAKQVEYYSTVYERIKQQKGSSAETKKHLSKSVFAIVIGSNDIMGYLGSSAASNKSTPQHFVNSILHSYNVQLKQLHKMGARKFMVSGVGVVGCCPQQRLKSETGECNEEANYWSLKYNEGLVRMLLHLESQLKGFKYSYLDNYANFHDVFDKRCAYGFIEVEAACCGMGRLRAELDCEPNATYCSNRDAYLFWDLYHPTEAAARIFANGVFSPTQNYTSPLNVDQLIAQ